MLLKSTPTNGTSQYFQLDQNHHIPPPTKIKIPTQNLGEMTINLQDRITKKIYTQEDIVSQREEILQILQHKPIVLVNTVGLKIKNHTSAILFKL